MKYLCLLWMDIVGHRQADVFNEIVILMNVVDKRTSVHRKKIHVSFYGLLHRFVFHLIFWTGVNFSLTETINFWSLTFQTLQFSFIKLPDVYLL